MIPPEAGWVANYQAKPRGLYEPWLQRIVRLNKNNGLENKHVIVVKI